MGSALVAMVALMAIALIACTKNDEDPSLVPVNGNGVQGLAAMERFECNRCHDGTALAAPAPEKQCMQCHRDILDGKAKGPNIEVDARWHERVTGYEDAPSLAATGARFRRRWIVDFLRHPHHLRPLLLPSMPRLAITETEANDIATYLVPVDDPAKERAEDEALLKKATPATGRELMIKKGCGSCHWMTGVTPLGVTLLPSEVTVAEPSRAMRLAPDLRFARDRTTAKKLIGWIQNPQGVKPDTLMPKIPLTDDEARDIAAYLFMTPLAPLPKKESPKPLPDLERRVTYDEVRDKVFQRTCWHCHSDPDLERGDTGPGNTGGFGFKARGLDLANYEALFAGTVDGDGERHSIFAPMANGTPRILAAMLARYREEAGDESATIRGMPLGLPPLSLEDIQLVSTWIAQGRPR
jgi:cytochrome c1